MKRARHGDIERFDQWATTYDRTPGQSFFRRIHRQVIDAVASRPVPPRLVVDIGCGTGRLLEGLLHRLPETELVGIDPSKGMIDVARRRFAREPRVRLEVATADRLPLADGSVDAVTTTMSFHHWEGQGASLHEVARVLAPDGRLLIADVLGIGVIGRLLRPRGRRHGGGYRNAAELAGLLLEAGFGAWRRRPLFGPGIPVFLVEARRKRP
jgi:ubiquinone/menaquinone biosynthesis C-methylase UbiE